MHGDIKKPQSHNKSPCLSKSSVQQSPFLRAWLKRCRGFVGSAMRQQRIYVGAAAWQSTAQRFARRQTGKSTRNCALLYSLQRCRKPTRWCASGEKLFSVASGYSFFLNFPYKPNIQFQSLTWLKFRGIRFLKNRLKPIEKFPF